MINIPQEIKDKLHLDHCQKNIRIHFPNGERSDICNDLIVKDTVNFTESLCSQDSLKFGLCEAPIFECETVGVGNIDAKKIEVYFEIYCDPDVDGAVWRTDLQHHVYPIIIGTFRVSSSKRQSDLIHRKITAYGGLSNYSFTASDINDAIDSPKRGGDGAPLYASRLIALALQTDALLDNEVKTIRTPSSQNVNIGDVAYEIRVLSTSNQYDYFKLYSDTQNPGSYTFSRVLKPDNTRVTVQYSDRAYFNQYYANTDAYEKYTPDNTKNLINFHNFPHKSISEQLSGLRGNIWNRMKGDRVVVGGNVYDLDEIKLYSQIFQNETLGVRRADAYRWVDPGYSNDIYTVESMRFWRSCRLRFYRDYVGPGFTYVMFIKDDGTRTDAYSVYDTNADGLLRSYLSALSLNNLEESCSLAKEELESQIEMIYEATETLDETGSVVYGITSDDYGPQLYKEDIGIELDLREFTQAKTELRGGFLYSDHFNSIRFVDIKQQFGLVPSSMLYPNQDLYPESVTGGKLLPQDYQSCWYDDYYTKPFGAIYCEYKNTDQEDASFLLYLPGFNSNTPADSYQVYDLSSNSMITMYSWTQAQIQAICNVIAANISGVAYMPVEFVGRGLPYVEAGDTFEILTKSNDSITTIVLNRTLSGDQTLTDTYKSV